MGLWELGMNGASRYGYGERDFGVYQTVCLAYFGYLIDRSLLLITSSAILIAHGVQFAVVSKSEQPRLCRSSQEFSCVPSKHDIPPTHECGSSVPGILAAWI